MMGGVGSGRRDKFRPAYARPLYRQREAPPPPPKPLEYQLVDLLSDEGLPEEVSEAIRLLLPFIGKCRRLDAVAAEEGELAAMQHDLERVMARENLYLNALMEITGLKEREAVKIAARALYGQQFKLPPEEEAQADRNPEGHDPEEGHGAKHESPVGEADAPEHSIHSSSGRG